MTGVLIAPDDPRLATLTLAHGQHAKPEQGMCFMEAAAWLRGVKFTDHPACVANTIGAAGRALNDGIKDGAKRTRLLVPLIPVVVGTATNAKDEQARAWMATDFLVRQVAPAWMECAGLVDTAAKLRAAPPLTSAEIATGLTDLLNGACKESAAARAAAWEAAWDAARDAGWDAARAAAWEAAWDAARAAAWDAAWAAAYQPAYAAAIARLTPTADRLNEECADLIRRMAAVGR